MKTFIVELARNNISQVQVVWVVGMYRMQDM